MKQTRKKVNEQQLEKVSYFAENIKIILDKNFEDLTLLESINLDILHSEIFSKRRNEKCNIDQFNELKKIR
jgi:hypothetical protein